MGHLHDGRGVMTTTPYSVGLCYASVCTDDDDATMLASINLSHPTGVGEWQIADEPFASGDPNPCPCNHDAAKRHVLVVC